MKKSKKVYVIIDIIIILIIIGFIYGYYKIAKSGISTEVNETLTYKIKVSNVSLEYIEKVHIGDTLYENLNNTSAGKITNIEYDNSYTYAYDEINHLYKKDIVNDQYDLYLDINSGVYDNTLNLFIGDLDIKIGREVNFTSDNYSLHGFIVDIVGEENENNKE